MDTNHVATQAAFPKLLSPDTRQIQTKEGTVTESEVIKLRDELFRLARELVARGPNSIKVAVIVQVDKDQDFCEYGSPDARSVIDRYLRLQGGVGKRRPLKQPLGVVMDPGEDFPTGSAAQILWQHAGAKITISEHSGSQARFESLMNPGEPEVSATDADLSDNRCSDSEPGRRSRRVESLALAGLSPRIATAFQSQDRGAAPVRAPPRTGTPQSQTIRIQRDTVHQYTTQDNAQVLHPAKASSTSEYSESQSSMSMSPEEPEVSADDSDFSGGRRSDPERGHRSRRIESLALAGLSPRIVTAFQPRDMARTPVRAPSRAGTSQTTRVRSEAVHQYAARDDSILQKFPRSESTRNVRRDNLHTRGGHHLDTLPTSPFSAGLSPGLSHQPVALVQRSNQHISTSNRRPAIKHCRSGEYMFVGGAT